MSDNNISYGGQAVIGGVLIQSPKGWSLAVRNQKNEILKYFEERVPLIMDYLKDKNVIYSVSIHADPHEVLERVKLVHKLGGNSVHVNFWCGMGIYKSIRAVSYTHLTLPTILRV